MVLGLTYFFGEKYILYKINIKLNLPCLGEESVKISDLIAATASLRMFLSEIHKLIRDKINKILILLPCCFRCDMVMPRSNFCEPMPLKRHSDDTNEPVIRVSFASHCANLLP